MKYLADWNKQDFSDHYRICLGQGRVVSRVEKAGDGNMNYTFRVTFADNTSVIIKQSPPFCAKFPTIPAPELRVLSEKKYYDLIDNHEFLLQSSPHILGYDHELKILYMEDLGEGADFEFVYKNSSNWSQSESDLTKLIQYLKCLHGLAVPADQSFENIQMRQLNYDYIFKLPFDIKDQAIDLDDVTPGLKALSQSFKTDELAKAAEELGKLYWQNTGTLIHGDYYPKSWLRTERGLFIIDPEFGFLGYPEVDIGFFLAHMLFGGNFLSAKQILASNYGQYDEAMAAQFCAVEVLRRLLYVSQLPVRNDLLWKKQLLEMSSEALLSKNLHVFMDI